MRGNPEIECKGEGGRYQVIKQVRETEYKGDEGSLEGREESGGGRE